MDLDRIIASISPKWALQRQLHRKHLERLFDAAQTSNYYKRRTDTRSPDAVMENTRERLRVITRHLDENHDLAIGVLDALTNNVIGTGIVVEPMVRKSKGELNDTLNDKIREEWELWTERCEITGELPWGELQRLVFRSWMRDGEVLIRHLSPRFRDGRIPYVIELLEGDWLPYDVIETRNNDDITHGVEKDAAGRPIAYHLYVQHPGDVLHASGFAVQLQTQRVPADEITHLKFVRRLNQTRGQPLLHGCIRRLEAIHQYEESEQVAARVAADMTAFIQRPSDIAGSTAFESDGTRSFEMQAGMVYDGLLPGETIGTIDSKRPNPSLQSFRNAMLRAVASGTGSTFSQISRDYSEGNYSSQRQELIEASTSYKRLHDLFVETFLRPVYRRFIQRLGESGRIPLVRFGSMEARKASTADFQGPQLPWIDPQKEAKANEILLKNKLESRHHIIRSRGRNPRTVDEQIESDQMEMPFDQEQEQPTAEEPEGEPRRQAIRR